MKCGFRKMSWCVVRAFRTTLFGIDVQKLFVDRADRLDRDDAKIICPESKSHLTRLHVAAAQELSNDIQVNGMDSTFFGEQFVVEHGAIEFDPQSLEEFVVQATFPFSDASSCQQIQKA